MFLFCSYSSFGPEVVARVTYARMRTSMRNARLSRFPNPLPANLVELTDILQDPRYTVITMSDDGLDNIYGGSVTDIDGFHHILFISERMLQRARTFRILHSDGTFRVTPHGPEFAVQVFCIVAVWNHHIITVGWVLMTSLTENAYTAVLQLLQQRLGPGIELTKVISDFETGQQNAWQNVFNVRTQGCVWHLSRAFLQEVAELNLVNRMRNIEEVRRIIRLTLGLALLPEPFIVDGYHVILNHAVGEGNYIYRMVLPYLRYVWRYWVSRPWRRARMCVHGSSQRTNNACESQNKVLREECGIHSNVYMFLAGLVRLEQKNYNILLSLDQFRRVSRARKTTSIMNDNRIQMATEELFDPPGPIAATIFRFLSVVSHTMDNMVEELMLDRLRRRRRQ
ncbi:Ribonuclease HII [Frankliniella fusca]|uniref:Ribonuclease HII n=1 Tax=Frankliniella fusca TaxID=407009 RepID=A0AAE1LIJ3_9NEOP|nr:Ribonuclease HII [Frankliniella fusca]